MSDDPRTSRQDRSSASADRSVHSDEPREPASGPARPLILTLLMWLMAFWAGACALTLVSVWLGEGPIMIDGAPTSREEVLDLLVPMLLPLGLCAGAAAMTLWVESPWARPTLLFALLLAGPFATYPRWSEATNPGGAPALGLLAVTPLLLLLWWYLYLKRDVVDYFRSVSERRYREQRGEV